MARKNDGWAMNVQSYFHPHIQGSSGPSMLSVLLVLINFMIAVVFLVSVISGQALQAAISGPALLASLFFLWAEMTNKFGPTSKVKLSSLMAQASLDLLVPAARKLGAGEMQLLQTDLWHYVQYLNSKKGQPAKIAGDRWNFLFDAKPTGGPVRGYCGAAATEDFITAHNALRSLAPSLAWPSQETNLVWVNGKGLWTLKDGTVIYSQYVETYENRTSNPVRPIQAQMLNSSALVLSKDGEISTAVKAGKSITYDMGWAEKVTFHAYRAEPQVAALTASQHTLANAVMRYDRVKTAWTDIITDPLNALTHCALFSDDDAVTDAFVKSFFKLEDAIEAAKVGNAVEGVDLADLAVETERRWATALTSAQRKSYSWLPPKQAADGQLAEKLLTLANNASAGKGERINAARRAADILESMDAVVFPKETAVSLELMGTKMKELTI